MKKLVLTLAVVTAFALSVSAKTTTWQGPSGGNWNAEDNWNGGLPATGDTVILNDSSVNDFEGLSLASITFAGSGAYTVSGNAVTVTGGAGLTVEAGATATNEIALTFSANQTWLIKSTGTLAMNASFDAGTHTLTVNAESTTKMGTLVLLKPNTISGKIQINQGKVYVRNDGAFGTAAVANNPSQAFDGKHNVDFGRFYFDNVTLANAFTIMDSNADGMTEKQAFNALAHTTNTFNGAVKFSQSSCYPTVPSSAKMIFAGSFTMSNYLRGGYYSDVAGPIEFMIPVTIKNFGYGGTSNLGDGNSRPHVIFSAAGSKISGWLMPVANAICSFTVDDALVTSSSGKSAIRNFAGTVDLNGTTQHLDGFLDCRADNGTLTSSEVATLYLKQVNSMGTAGTPYGGAISGRLNVSKSGANPIVLGGSSKVRTFTTSGYLEVTEGDLELNAKAIWSSGDVRVSGSGNLILNDIANLPNTSVITVTTNETSTAKITLNGTVQVAKLIINGEQLDEDAYTKENLGELIAGDGAMVVSDPSRQPKTTTWTGAAGGNWSDRDNWDNGKPLAADTVVLTASSVNDIPNLLLGGLTYGGKGGYETTGQGVTLNGPLSTITEPDGDVGLVRVFTNDLPITISGTQTWTIESTNTTLVCTQPITSLTLLTCNGRGSLELRADNALTGGFYTHTANVHAYRDAAFSATGDGKVEILRNGASRWGRLWLHGVTLKNPLTEVDNNDHRHGLVSAAGTTNVLQGRLTTSSSIFIGVQKNSTLILEGGARSENQNLFRPCGGYSGGDKTSGTGDKTSWLIVRNKPLENFQGLSYDEMCCTRFEVAGNDFTKSQQDEKQKYSGVTVMARVETAVPYVFDYADGSGAIRRLHATLDLCGNDQRLGGFTFMDYNDGSITSEQPATLYLVQKLMQSNGASKPAIQPLKQDIAGAVSLSKAGTNTTYLTGTKTTTGRLEVTEGDLVLDANAAWSGTNVVVAGTNEVASMGTEILPGNLILNASKNLSKDTVLSVYGNGTLTIPAGTTIRVGSLWRADAGGELVRLDPGDYTADNCTFVKGEGRLHARGTGIVLLLR